MMRVLMTKMAQPQRTKSVWLMIGLVASALMMPAAPALAQSTESNSALMARQQMRLNTIEDNLKTVRGTLETEFRAIRLRVEELVENAAEDNRAQSAAIKGLKAQMSELGDTLDIFNQRLRRSIELSSDVEFRVLRLEKRMQTLLSLGSDDLTNAILQDDLTAGGTAPAVSMSRDNDTGGATWTVEKDPSLTAELAKSQTDNQSVADNQSADPDGSADGSADELAADLANDNASEDGDNATQIAANTDATAASTALDNGTQDAVTQESGVQETGINTDEAAREEVAAIEEAAPEEVIEEEVVASVLPEGTAEEQYRFAFGRMLQNDLETAEAGFIEFRAAHAENERSADALYWLGRVQFIQGDFGQSAMSFTEFNSEFPNDSRLPEAILMIAESVLNFATPEQACQIFVDLPQMLDQPSASFVKRLGELKVAASCEG